MSENPVPNHQREFRCKHCNGKILIPRDLPPTTGPCPHCSGVITSPAPETQPAATFHAPAAPPKPAPAPAPAQARPAPVATPPAASAPPPRDQPSPASPEPATGPSERGARIDSSRNKPRKEEGKRSILFHLLMAFILLVALGFGVVVIASEMAKKKASPAPAVSSTSAIAEANYIRIGWRTEANEVLQDFINGRTVAEKLPHILDPGRIEPLMEEFYGGGIINDTDTPVDGFSVYELSEVDRNRGIFMMVYDQPLQPEMKEFFRPLVPLEVQHGLEEMNLLLSAVTLAENFAMEPLRVFAFFKRTPEGLKLDWETFAQTKYRTFQNFVELPSPGQSEIFRVFIVEDVPDKGRAVAGTRTYRMADPANPTDTTRVNVKIDSETGRALSIINWRGTTENRAITRTATVELRWTEDHQAPELEISRLICWEFLGLGGEGAPAPVSTQ